MSIVPIIVIVAVAILGMYFLLNKKSEEKDKEGIVRDILKKDALVMDFGDGRRVVVKFFGISIASDGEMLDDKILSLLDDTIRGHRVNVKPVVVESPEIMSAEIRTLSGEYVNAMLVRQGFARWVASEASADSDLADAQMKAQAEQLGVWNPAIIQLLQDRRDSARMSDDEVANMSVDPEELESRD